jgi:hypothetical protein
MLGGPFGRRTKMQENTNYTVNEVNEFCNEYAGLDRLKTTKTSLLFKFQYFDLYKQGIWDLLAIKDAIWNIDNNVIDKTGMKPDKPFSEYPLLGLWKKHWFDLNFINGNLINDLQSRNSYGKKKVNDELQERGSMTPTEVAISLFYESLNGRIGNDKYTGEWIVYHKKDNAKIILTFANHHEGNNRKDGDQNIYERIKSSCKEEFPEIFTKDGFFA